MSSAVQQDEDHVIVDGRDLTWEVEWLQGKLRHPAFGTPINIERRFRVQTQIEGLEREICQAAGDDPMPATPSGRLFFGQSSD